MAVCRRGGGSSSGIYFVLLFQVSELSSQCNANFRIIRVNSKTEQKLIDSSGESALSELAFRNLGWKRMLLSSFDT